jgi:hypothetical protein
LAAHPGNLPDTGHVPEVLGRRTRLPAPLNHLDQRLQGLIGLARQAGHQASKPIKPANSSVVSDPLISLQRVQITWMFF